MSLAFARSRMTRPIWGPNPFRDGISALVKSSGDVRFTSESGHRHRGETMKQNLAGKCACGTIQYETNADPIVMLNCHCSDCRKANGSAYAALIILPKSAVKLRGEPRFHMVLGGSGKRVERGFCPSCGSQVIVRIEKLPDALAIQAGTLDDPTLFSPSLDIYTDSAPPGIICNPLPKNFQKGAVERTAAARRHVRFGSQAEITTSPANVRFPPESGHSLARRCERLHSTFPDGLGRTGRGKKFD